MRQLTASTVVLVLALMAVAPAAAQQRRPGWVERAISLESAHPYPLSAHDELPIREPGVAEIRLHFARIDMEEGFDFLEVRDGRGELVERYTGEHRNVWTPPISGDTALLRLVSDENVARWGFSIDRVAHRGPVEVVSDVRSLRIELPGGPTIKAGRTAPLSVVGLDPTGAPTELVGHPIYFNIRGPVQVLARDLAEGRYKIVAAESLRVEEEAVIVAYSGRSPKITGQAKIRVIPARPLVSLAVSCGAREIEAGQTVEFTVVGRPRDGRGGPQALTPREVKVSLTGPGRIVPLPGDRARYRYEAPPSFAGAKSAVISARLLDDGEVRGKHVLALVLPYSGIEIRCRSPKVSWGQSVELEVVGRPRRPGGKPVVLPEGDLVLDHGGPGKLTRLGGGRLRYDAPATGRGLEGTTVSVRMKGDPATAATLALTLVRPDLRRPAGVPEVSGLVRITRYETREDDNAPWKKRELPGPGEVFRNRLQNHRFQFVVSRPPPVLLVEVDIQPEDSPREVATHREGEASLTVSDEGRTTTGEFKEQFREGKGIYLVTFYVWTAPDRCERQTIRVLRGRREE